jgi:hypothetical protein
MVLPFRPNDTPLELEKTTEPSPAEAVPAEKVTDPPPPPTALAVRTPAFSPKLTPFELEKVMVPEAV